ncbi:MAG TPA: hypothetical protein QGF52_00190 [Nitrososphaerales archaeon]|jgi:hypothetical protein|nr:hypothetical protein [Nitrososphaerales archaeon]|tara:strand:+ start:31 stop:288 length:258 start_codon:yes stop_codon:yes gene_type:complete
MDEIFYIIRMVCWIKRIRRLGINVSLDDDIEKELMKELDISNHDELESSIKFLHDETLESIMENILKRRKKISVRRKELAHDMYR